jgi:hypothetical protein
VVVSRHPQDFVASMVPQQKVEHWVMINSVNVGITLYVMAIVPKKCD